MGFNSAFKGLIDVNYDYMFRLKLVVITSVPDMSIYHSIFSMF